MQSLLARSFVRMREDKIAAVNLALILVRSQNHFQCSGGRSLQIRLSQRELNLSKTANAQVVDRISCIYRRACQIALNRPIISRVTLNSVIEIFCPPEASLLAFKIEFRLRRA